LKNVAAGLLIAAVPWLASGLAAAADFPPLLAYVLFPGRGLFVLLGSVVAVWALLRERVAWSELRASLETVAARRTFALLGLALVAGVAFARVPQEEKEADAFGGDEPKYLRIAFSLLRDTDADIGSGRTNTPDLAMRTQQLRHLALSTRDAVVDLFRPLEIPEGHVWNAGNWTVRGRDGGLYHLQPPGFPALVAVALGIGEIVLPERDPGIFVFVLLAVVWIFAARELWLLSLDLSPDVLGSAVLVCLVFLSAPVFIGGYQLFPESLCLLLFPWLFRRLGTTDRRLENGAAIACGLICGYLLWVHPKLTIVAAFFAGLALLRPNAAPRARFLFFVAFSLIAFSSLLYCHHISGLFRPEGLYIRQAEEYVGSPNPLSWRFAAGLVKAVLGGRDGLLIFAPVLSLGFVLGMFGLKDASRKSRADLELSGLFLVVWLTSAVHDGASLGSPARLMAPVAFIPAIFLVRALRGTPTAKLCATAALFFALGCLITETMTSDWRRNVNPYRTMFANPPTNFESSLPGNSFSDEAYAVDLEKGGLLFLALLLIGGLVSRRSAGTPGDWAPTRFGLGVLVAVSVLAFGLDWLGSP
jgi:hypothetical protein